MQRRFEDVSIDLADVRCVRVPRTADPVVRNAVYACWRETWFELYDELGIADYRSSDAFLAQAEHLCVFAGPTCIASIGIRHIGHALDADWEDSSVQMLGAERIARLRDAREDLHLLSGLNVAAPHRKRNASLPVALLLSSFIARYLQASKARLALAVARRDVGVPRILGAFGGEAIAEDVPFRGKQCDVVLVEREKIRPFPFPEFAPMFRALITGASLQLVR